MRELPLIGLVNLKLNLLRTFINVRFKQVAGIKTYFLSSKTFPFSRLALKIPLPLQLLFTSSSFSFILYKDELMYQ